MLVVGIALKIRDFSAIPIYGSMFYKAPPEDDGNENWVNGTIINGFQNKMYSFLKKKNPTKSETFDLENCSLSMSKCLTTKTHFQCQ